MQPDIDDNTREFIRKHKVARLATSSLDGQPSVIPICYIFEGDSIYSPIDEKPKSVSPSSLKRVRNIKANPQVSIVVDDYSDDWSKLVYVLISGLAEIIEPGAYEHARAVTLLRDKYPQYCKMSIDDRPIIKIIPGRIKRWGEREQ